MTVSGILGFDNPRWLRGGPSSQSSPGGRRGKTSRPHPCLSPRAGCVHKVAAAFVDVGGPIPAAPRRRAWRRVPSLSLPQRGRGLGAPSQRGAVRESGRVATRPYGRGRRGKTSRPHPCLSPRAGCARKVAAGFVDVGGPIPATPRRRAWRRVPSLSLPQRGRGLGAPSPTTPPSAKMEGARRP